MIPAASLFDRPADAPWFEATSWLDRLLSGSLSVTLCLLAVVLLGYAMLAGRLPIRRGFLVVLGCFLLLAGPLLAGEALERFQQASGATPEPFIAVIEPEPVPPPPANYDPYAGASLRRDR